MKKQGAIITVGLCPAWDRVCEFDGIEWGEHKLVSGTSIRPAGKAMNISHALAWMGRKNIAAGLWGEDDYGLLLRAMKPLSEFVKVKVTVAEGSTRQNVTVVDTKNKREMHLRHRGTLACKKSLRWLRMDLLSIVKEESTCVFAGLTPGQEYLGDIIKMIKLCSGRGARVVVDTSGPALREIVETGAVWMIKPNVEEFCELVGREVTDRPASLVKAAKTLLEKVEVVLISRGAKGAVLVRREGAWEGRCVGKNKVLATVGCGDYMLAGFLEGLSDGGNYIAALETAVKVGTAKAWGLVESMSWGWVGREMRIEIAGMD